MSETRDWVFDSVLQFLGSPLWTHQILSFIDEQCQVFDTEEENSFEHTKVHEAFKELVEKLLESHLEDLGISPEEFVGACEKGAGNPTNDALLRHILAVDDFLTFKALMVKRNIELNQEAIDLWTKRQQHIDEGNNDDGNGDLDLSQLDEEEEALIRQAIAESQKEFEKASGKEGMTEEEYEKALQASIRDIDARKAAEAKEQAELEMAIAMSLALEEEKKREIASVASEPAAAAEKDEEKKQETSSAAAAASSSSSPSSSSSSSALPPIATSFRAETNRRVEAEKSAKAAEDEAKIAALERERLAKEAMIARRAAEAKKIMDELKEARDTAERTREAQAERDIAAAEKARSKRAPPSLAAAPGSSGADSELKERQEFLKRVRATLVAQKAKTRQSEADAYRAKIQADPAVAKAAAASSSGASSGPSHEEEERMRMRIALGQRMKKEMLSSGSKSEAQMKEEMDKQLAIVEQERDRKKRTEHEAKLREMKAEADRQKALSSIHEKMSLVDAADDDFDFKE